MDKMTRPSGYRQCMRAALPTLQQNHTPCLEHQCRGSADLALSQMPHLNRGGTSSLQLQRQASDAPRAASWHNQVTSFAVCCAQPHRTRTSCMLSISPWHCCDSSACLRPPASFLILCKALLMSSAAGWCCRLLLGWDIQTTAVVPAAAAAASFLQLHTTRSNVQPSGCRQPDHVYSDHSSAMVMSACAYTALPQAATLSAAAGSCRPASTLTVQTALTASMLVPFNLPAPLFFKIRLLSVQKQILSSFC